MASEGAFVSSQAALMASRLRHRFLRSYGKLAELCVQENRLLFNIVPKMHYLRHMVHDLKVRADKRLFVHNPIRDATFEDEDFIGDMCRLSRGVSPKLVAFQSFKKIPGRACRPTGIARAIRLFP